jgi:hypothetical protein
VLLVDRALLDLDAATAGRVRPVLDWMRSGDARERPGDPDAPDIASVRRFLWQELPSRWPGGDLEHHEVAWALGELFERAGLTEEAALCRSSATHEVLSVWRWTRSFPDVPDAFWQAARSGLGPPAGPPRRAGLSLASARGLLEAVGEGLTLTAGGLLPRATVFALDDRFRWTEEFPWMRPEGETDIPPLRFLHEHLTAQQLLVRDGRRLTTTDAGRAALADPARLWWSVVQPSPRWTQEFDRDVLGVMAAALLRTGAFTSGLITEEVTHVLAAKWRPTGVADRASVFDGAALVVQQWYQLGVPLGWWDTGHGPADRRPNLFGRAAAEAVFRSSRVRADERPA